jgi:hypothetical protein
MLMCETRVKKRNVIFPNVISYGCVSSYCKIYWCVHSYASAFPLLFYQDFCLLLAEIMFKGAVAYLCGMYDMVP